MNRRKFIKSSLGVSMVTVSALTFGTSPKILSNIKKSENELLYDLTAVKGGDPDVMFNKAIKAVGGMSRYVKKNQTVVIKPNIGWNAEPERAANTNPKLISKVIEHCLHAGAKDVYVFDHTCDNWQLCYTNSGIEKAVNDAGGKLIPGNSESYYQSVEIKKGKSLREAAVHEIILESDVFINIPVLKHHSSTNLSIAMKNLMGAIWDRRYWHRNDLHQCIADYPTFRKPDLNIIDAYLVMKKNGPKGVSKDDCVPYKSLIVSPDIVAADAAAAKIFGHDPDEIDYIKIADEMGVGTMNLEKLSISRIKI
ncbi:MAG: DUF362 domain-containing protein [Bacteroidota bacterium]